MKSARALAVCISLFLLVVGFLPSHGAAATQALTLSSATLTGNLTTTDAFGDTGIGIRQPTQTFAESALLACEVVYNSANGATTLGASGWNIQNFGGQRSLVQGVGIAPGSYTRYANTCSKGYNESDQLVLHTSFQFKEFFGSTSQGSVQIGFANIPGAVTYDQCGPFLELTLGTTTNIIKIGLGIAKNGVNVFGPKTTVALSNLTWYEAWVWSNRSHQDAALLGPGGILYHLSSSFVFTVGQCATSSGNQMGGTNLLLNQTSSGAFAFTNTTIGAYLAGGGFMARGYVQFSSILLPNVLSSITFSTLIPPGSISSGLGYVGYASGQICPCYVNSTSGVVLWSTSSAYTPNTTALGTVTIPVSNITSGILVNMAFRLLSIDGLPRTFISSISIPGPLDWTNPYAPGQDNTNSLFAVDWLTPLVFVLGLGAMLFTVFIYYREAFAK